MFAFGHAPPYQIVLDIDAEVFDSVVGLDLAKQALDGTEISRCRVSNRRRGAAKWMNAIVLSPEPDGLWAVTN